MKQEEEDPDEWVSEVGVVLRQATAGELAHDAWGNDRAQGWKVWAS